MTKPLSLDAIIVPLYFDRCRPGIALQGKCVPLICTMSLHLNWANMLMCRQKKDDMLPSTAAGVSPHQDAQTISCQPVLSSLLSGLKKLFSAGVLPSNVLSSMHDVQCQIRAQLEQQHHGTS